MKTSITIVLLAIIFGSKARAQTNLNFENWSGNNPTGWTTSNGLSTSGGGSQTVFQETSSPALGSSSVKLITGSCPDCPSFLQNNFWIDCTLPNPFGGSIELSPSQMSPGIPYSQRPLSVDIMYKSLPLNGDAAAFHMILTKYNPSTGESEDVGEAYFEVSSVVSNWTLQNIPVVYYSSNIPDTMNMSAVSSVGSVMDCSTSMIFQGLPSPYDDWGLPYPEAGSEFEIDNIIINLPSCETLEASISGTSETNTGLNDGTAQVTVSGGTTPYSYAWSNGGTTPSVNNLSPGAYTVTVTDANGCQETKSYIVSTVGCDLSVSVSGTNTSTVSIFTGSGSVTANISGSSSYDIEWNTGATETGVTSSTISNLAIGSYGAIVSDQNDIHCASIISYTVFGPNGSPTEIENKTESLFEIFPNPSQDFIQINWNEASKVNYQIIDISGKVCLEGEIASKNEQVNVSDLPSGSYLIKVKSEEKLVSKVLIIN